MLQCRSKALTLAKNLWLFRTLISTCCSCACCAIRERGGPSRIRPRRRPPCPPSRTWCLFRCGALLLASGRCARGGSRHDGARAGGCARARGRRAAELGLCFTGVTRLGVQHVTTRRTAKRKRLSGGRYVRRARLFSKKRRRAKKIHNHGFFSRKSRLSWPVRRRRELFIGHGTPRSCCPEQKNRCEHPCGQYGRL